MSPGGRNGPCFIPPPLAAAAMKETNSIAKSREERERDWGWIKIRDSSKEENVEDFSTIRRDSCSYSAFIIYY